MATLKSLSIEDRNLNKSSIVTSRSRAYSDIDLLFLPKRNGDVYKKSDAGAVKQAIKNLILTNNFEKPFLPYYGGNIAGLLFELADDELNPIFIEDNIRIAIENYEPRAEVLNVFADLQADNNTLNVRLVFKIISTQETVTLDTSISRLR